MNRHPHAPIQFGFDNPIDHPQSHLLSIADVMAGMTALLGHQRDLELLDWRRDAADASPEMRGILYVLDACQMGIRDAVERIEAEPEQGGEEGTYPKLPVSQPSFDTGSDWKSAEEWARMGLSGIPTTCQNINNLAVREGWRENHPEKARPRRGRGGGWEYHYSLLPIEAMHEFEQMRVEQAQSA